MVCSRRRRRGIIRAPETDCGTEETVMLKTWSSGDALTIRVFGKEAEVSVFSLGDSRFDENEDCREDGFPLNREELDCLNWFLENVNISDCRREIAAYCNAMYTGTGRPPRQRIKPGAGNPDHRYCRGDQRDYAERRRGPGRSPDLLYG